MCHFGSSPENEAVENGSFWVGFSGELYIYGKSKVPSEVAHLLCVVEIIVW